MTLDELAQAERVAKELRYIATVVEKVDRCPKTTIEMCAMGEMTSLGAHRVFFDVSREELITWLAQLRHNRLDRLKTFGVEV